MNYLTTLVCIGYGFGDHHINQVIRDWLEFSSERNLTIVDPKATHIPNGLLHLAPQVDLVASDCTDYLDQVGGMQGYRSSRQHDDSALGNGRKEMKQTPYLMHSFRRKEIITLRELWSGRRNCRCRMAM